MLGTWLSRLIFRLSALKSAASWSARFQRQILNPLNITIFISRIRDGTQLECCSAASRRRCPLANVQDGFPQQRSWSDRSGIKPASAEPISARSHSFPLKPPVVAAGASSRTMKIETLSVDFTDEQKRYLEGFTTGLQISRVGRGLGGAAAGKANAEPTGPEAAHIKAQDRITRLGQEARRPGKVEARGASVRRLSAAEAAGAGRCAAVAGGQFPLALLRPVLCRADAGFLHVPAADSERHHEALAVCRACRSDRAAVRTVRQRHHPRQSSGARNSAEATRSP